MAHSIMSTIDSVHSEDSSDSRVASKLLVNIWLGVLGVYLVGTLLCTIVLLAWPIVAQLAAG